MSDAGRWRGSLRLSLMKSAGRQQAVERQVLRRRSAKCYDRSDCKCVVASVSEMFLLAVCTLEACLSKHSSLVVVTRPAFARRGAESALPRPDPRIALQRLFGC